MTTKTQIGILGIGAIGTVIASSLQEQLPLKLFYFSRTKKEALKLVTTNKVFDTSIHIETRPTQAPQLDWLFICLKAHQYNDAKHWFAELITPQTKVAVVRNGLRLKEDILSFTSGELILETNIDCPTELLENGFYKTINTPIITLQKNTLATEFKELFKASEVTINHVKDFKTESWKKLCESATLGAILCIHNDTCRIFKTETIQQQFKELLNEMVQVALADGAHIEPNFIDKTMTKVLKYPDTKGSSMLSDLRQGKPLELDAKNGIVSRLGKQYHIKTPINDSIIKLLS